MRQGNFTVRPDYFEVDCSHPLAQGLVFAGLGRFPGTTYYHDSSLWGNHAALTNMDPATDWVWQSSIQRWRLDFSSASSQYVAANVSTDATDVSMTLWANLDYSALQYPICLGSGTSTIRCGFFISSSANLILGVFNGVDVSQTAIGQPTGWHHVAVTMDPNATQKVQIYLDGAPASMASNGAATLAACTKLNIGRRVDNAWYFNSSLSDPCVWNRILSSAEIRQIAEPGNVMLSVGGNPLLRYRRKWWPVSSGGAVTTKRNLILGGGVI